MSNHRNYFKFAAIAIAVSAASPLLADETRVMVDKGTHHYVYYRDHDIYFAPDSKTYYWMSNGSWQAGQALPTEYQGYISSGGVNVDLDTMRPYERNDYVISHYKNSDPSTQQTTTTERKVSDNGATQTTTSTTTTTSKHSYVYYGDRDIYFAPDTKTYFWMADGSWKSGTTLPPESQPYVRNGGVKIELDTDRPYDRNEYVIAHYKNGHDHDDDLKHNDH
jgi:hypothetical protein